MREEAMTRHTDEELERAAARFEQITDALDPESVRVDNTEDLARVAHASQAVRDDEADLRRQVAAARDAGRSWNQIAVALGVSRQAARQRFAEKAEA